MKLLILFLLSILESACVSVRDDDLTAWKNVPLLELETHPLFSAMELEKRAISDGSELWVYTNKGNLITKCAYGTCSSGQPTCMNEFLVNQGMVKWYKPVGSCYTDCSTRPESHPCGSIFN